MSKVSIIVPVYNVEQYLHQCLDSICGQTLDDIVIILVNDGSTDGSLAILNEYAKRDKRIIIIDKPNEGYGKSMNRGLDAASGEYIGIVEPDDWIEPDMYATLYSIAKTHEVDVVKCRFWEYGAESLTDKRISHMPEMDTGHVINPRKNPAIFAVIPSIWSSIYRRDFLNGKKSVFWSLQAHPSRIPRSIIKCGR
jgi:glycosyltransferase involved in cell wall biosynthesis